MGNRSNRIAVVSAAIAVAGVATSRAESAFVGGGVISLDSWNQQASADIGQAVTVWRMYLSFDGQDPNTDQVNSIFGVTLHVDGTLYQDAFGDPSGVHPNGAFIGVVPSLAWDSFVSINTLTSNDGAAAAPDGDGVNFNPNGLDQSGWFLAGSDQGLAGTNAGSDDYGTGLNLVLIGQFTIFGAGTGEDVMDFRSGGVGAAGRFFGHLNIGVNDQSNPQIIGVMIPPWPSPGGGVTLLMGLGLVASRRR